MISPSALFSVQPSAGRGIWVSSAFAEEGKRNKRVSEGKEAGSRFQDDELQRCG